MWEEDEGQQGIRKVKIRDGDWNRLSVQCYNDASALSTMDMDIGPGHIFRYLIEMR